MTGYEAYVLRRDRLGYKDSYVASQAGIPASTFSDWKKGKSSPKREKMDKIAKVIDVPTDYLMTGDPKYLYFSYSSGAEPTLTLEETRLINAYRKADELTQQMILRLLGLEQDADSNVSKEA